MDKNIRIRLDEWARDTFGEIGNEELCHINEKIVKGKDEGDRISTIEVYVRKKKGIKQAWSTPECFDRWHKELIDIIGDGIIAMRMDSAESNEMRLRGGMIRLENEKEKTFQEMKMSVYQYKFNLVISKMYGVAI